MRAKPKETVREMQRRIARDKADRMAWEWRRRKTVGILCDAASLLNDSSVPDGPLQERALAKVAKVVRMWTTERGKK